jgi:hypothetical protein
VNTALGAGLLAYAGAGRVQLPYEIAEAGSPLLQEVATEGDPLGENDGTELAEFVHDSARLIYLLAKPRYLFEVRLRGHLVNQGACHGYVHPRRCSSH